MKLKFFILLITYFFFLGQGFGQIVGYPGGNITGVNSYLGVRIVTTGGPTPLVGFPYNLDTSSVTSAGVYESDGTLIRTLWSNVRQDAGAYQGYWDGEKDSLGIQAPVGDYTVRVLINNVNYVWEGARIGNTSTDISGSTRYRGHSGGFYDFAFVGSKMYTAKGSNEMNPSSDLIDSSDYGRKTNIFTYGDFNTNQGSCKAISDGVRVYYSGFDGFGTMSFTYAINLSDHSYYTFSAGVNVKCMYGINYSAIADATLTATGTPIASAVQKNGNFLLVAWSNSRMTVINKITGAVVRTNTIAGISSLALSGYNTVWVATSSGMTRYTLNSDGSLTTLGTTIALNTAVAMDVSPDSTTLAVSDNATMQVRAYGNTTGTASWVLGQSGGYSSNSTVANDKFSFYGPQFTFVKFAPNGTLWVGDPGCYRAQHFSSTRQWLNTMQSLGNNYSCSVDMNDSSRVFAGILEFHIDYSKALDAPGAVTFVRNWEQNLKGTKWYNNLSTLPVVTTLSNGRTYATVTPPSNDTTEIVELVTGGVIRYTGVRTPNVAYLLQKNGDLALANEQGGNLVWIRKPRTGFTSNNPTYGSDVVDATITSPKLSDPLNGAFHPYQKTPAGRYFLFYQGKIQGAYGKGYHMGFLNSAGNKFSALNSFATDAGYEGQFPNNGDFDVANGSTGAGSNAAFVGETVVRGFFGEFWKASQTNIYTHYDLYGLMIGQFGVAGPDVAGQEAAPKMAGNALFFATTSANGVWYLYHGDESHNGGIHRWTFSRMNTIHYQTYSITKGAAAPPAPPVTEIQLIDNTDPIQNWFITSDMTSRSYNTISSNARHPALRVFNFGTSGTKVASRLTTFTSAATDSFVFRGNLLYQGSDPMRAGGDSSNFEFLDNNNRVIARINRQFDGTVCRVYFNNIVLFSGDYNTVMTKFKYATNFKITGRIENVTIQMDNGARITTAPVDGLANPLYPNLIRAVFVMSDFVGYHDIGMQDFYIIKK